MLPHELGNVFCPMMNLFYILPTFFLNLSLLGILKQLFRSDTERATTYILAIKTNNENLQFQSTVQHKSTVCESRITNLARGRSWRTAQCQNKLIKNINNFPYLHFVSSVQLLWQLNFSKTLGKIRTHMQIAMIRIHISVCLILCHG